MRTIQRKVRVIRGRDAVIHGVDPVMRRRIWSVQANVQVLLGLDRLLRHEEPVLGRTVWLMRGRTPSLRGVPSAIRRTPRAILGKESPLRPRNRRSEERRVGKECR